MKASNGARRGGGDQTRRTDPSFGARRSVVASITREISTLDPGYFSLVMATGIVSNGLYLQEQRAVSDALLAVGLAAYVWLCLLTGLRAAISGAALRADLASSRTVFLFFTFVAATDVLALATLDGSLIGANLTALRAAADCADMAKGAPVSPGPPGPWSAD